MKNLVIATVMVVLGASIAGAVAWHGSINRTNFTKYVQATGVNGDILYQVQGTNCRMYINASSASVIPLTSGTRYEASVPGSVTALAFKCNSAASTAQNAIIVIK